jgi:hypothetical protein
MGSCRHPKEVFDPLDLEIMERVLDAALRTLKAHHVRSRAQDGVTSGTRKQFRQTAQHASLY